MNILIISPDFNYSCGVSKHVFGLLNYLNNHSTFNIYFITNSGDALTKLAEHNINYTIISFSKGWKNIFYFTFNYLHIKKFCLDKKINIIHTHHRYPELLSTLIAKRLNIKIITTSHSLVTGYKYLSFKSDKIIAVSNSVKTYIAKYFHIREDKIETLYNCLPFTIKSNINLTDKLRKKLNVDRQVFKILYLGRINRVKGSDILIDAFNKLKNSVPLVKLFLVGNISDEKVVTMIHDNIEDVISIPPQCDVSLFYDICDLVILPSREEALGNTMLEAGYFKKPFIGSRTGGIAEFIDDGINGFLFEPGNADDLVNRIKFVINNPGKAKSAVEELHRKVKKYCNCEKYFEKLTSIYEELLNSK